MPVALPTSPHGTTASASCCRNEQSQPRQTLRTASLGSADLPVGHQPCSHSGLLPPPQLGFVFGFVSPTFPRRLEQTWVRFAIFTFFAARLSRPERGHNPAAPQVRTQANPPRLPCPFMSKNHTRPAIPGPYFKANSESLRRTRNAEGLPRLRGRGGRRVEPRREGSAEMASCRFEARRAARLGGSAANRAGASGAESARRDHVVSPVAMQNKPLLRHIKELFILHQPCRTIISNTDNPVKPKSRPLNCFFCSGGRCSRLAPVE